MPRWIKRCLWAVVLGGALPTGVMAQGEPAAKTTKAQQVIVNADPYRAATPYNGTVVGRPVPASHWNMTNYTLSCDLPNLNTAAYVAPECCCGGGGCGSGCDNGCGSLFSRFGGCGNSCDTGCKNSCNSGCGSLFSGWRLGNGCGTACGNSCNTCSTPCTTTCNDPCKSSCGSLFSGWKSNNGCTSSCAPTCPPACNTGCRQVHSHGNTCDSGCGNAFGWKFRYKDNCGSCNTGCTNSCNTCDSGCGSLFSGWRDRFSFGCKKDSCDDCGDRGHRGWFRWNGGCGNDCGCSSPCNSGCGSVTPSATPTPIQVQPKTMPPTGSKPVSHIEPVAFWNIIDNHKAKKERAEERENGCLSCPVHGPTVKHTLPRASTLGCTGCSTFESEAVFLFGSCRQFFGEPTWKWMHGK